MGDEVTIEQAQEITSHIAYNKEEDTINYVEFVMASIDRNFYYNDMNITSVFKRFDINNSNVLNYNDLINGFIRYGYVPKQIDKLRKELESMKDRTITLEGFILKIKSDGLDMRESNQLSRNVNDWERYELDLNGSRLRKKAHSNTQYWLGEKHDNHSTLGEISRNNTS